MPANQFKCPNGDKILIEQCLRNCAHCQRCIALPTLQALANSVKSRGLDKPSVTQLIKGTAEAALMQLNDYAVNPKDLVNALMGTGIHSVIESNTTGKIISEVRLENDIFSGQLDCLGRIFSRHENTLLDHKTTSSYKIVRALGMHQVTVGTGTYYKTGLNKGKEKTRKEWRSGGYKSILDYAIQLNAYRMLAESAGYRVDNMALELFCKDYNTRIAAERGITSPVVYVHVNKISDRWLMRYFKAKKSRLEKALAEGVDKSCNARERWGDAKCKSYCSVASLCEYGRKVKGLDATINMPSEESNAA